MGQNLFERGRAAWPEIQLDPTRLAAHVERINGGEEVDLYLACACAEGDTAALAIFDREHLVAVATFVARIDPSPAFAEEVRQLLREKLLVAGPGERPRIAEYAGRGPLGGWVRAAAVRTAIDLVRKRTDEPVSGSHLDRADLDAIDPEAAVVRERYRDTYQEALRTALANRSPKERNLLRMCFVDGLSVDQIGVAYRVHRATAARWIQAARSALADDVHDLLRSRLGISGEELASLTNVMQSQLHLSLSALFKA